MYHHHHADLCSADITSPPFAKDSFSPFIQHVQTKLNTVLWSLNTLWLCVTLDRVSDISRSSPVFSIQLFFSFYHKITQPFFSLTLLLYTLSGVKTSCVLSNEFP